MPDESFRNNSGTLGIHSILPFFNLDGLEEIEAKHCIVGKTSVPLTTQKSYFKALFYLGTLAKKA